MLIFNYKELFFKADGYLCFFSTSLLRMSDQIMPVLSKTITWIHQTVFSCTRYTYMISVKKTLHTHTHTQYEYITHGNLITVVLFSI